MYLLFVFFKFKTPGFKNGVYEVKYKCDECTQSRFSPIFKQQRSGRVFHSQAFDAFGIIQAQSVSFSHKSVYKQVKIVHVYIELMHLKGSYIFPINIRFKFEFKSCIFNSVKEY